MNESLVIVKFGYDGTWFLGTRYQVPVKNGFDFRMALSHWARSDNKKLLYHVCILTQIILVICYIISSLRFDNRDILDYFSDITYIFNFNFQQLNFHIDASSCMLCHLLFIICMSSIYSSSSVTDHVDFHLISSHLLMMMMMMMMTL